MKLSPITIIILGIAVAVIALSYGFFWQVVPNLQEAHNFDQSRETLQTAADQLPMANKRVAQAKQLVETSVAQWRDIAMVRTPVENINQGGISLAVNAYQLSVDTQKYRNSVQKAVNARVRLGGVKVVNGPYVTGPAVDEPASQLLANYYNFGQYPFPVVIFDLGTVTVQGTYQQILANVRSWKNMPHYLAVTDGLQITGTSPVLTGTYNLQVVGFIRGKDIFPDVPEAAASTSGGGMGARAGGPGFGGPGGGRGMMPPGMPPGVGGPRGPSSAGGGRAGAPGGD